MEDLAMRSLMIRPNRFAREIDNLFTDFMRFPSYRSEDDCDFCPRVNIRETKDDIRLTFEVPGMDRKDIKVTVKDGILTVSGERKSVEQNENDRWVRNEIVTGSFSRSFTLPETVDPEKISADYKHGMLEVTLAKKEVVKPKEIEVSVS
jgi:HSP20 family protein